MPTRISRRHLGQLAGAALAGRAFAAPGAKGNVVIGVQSYSFRDRSLDDAIAAMVQVGLKSCELWQGHVEPPRGTSREDLRKWRLETPLDHFKQVRAKFKKAGIDLYAYNLSFKDDFTDEEIARGFEMAKAMGVRALTASAHQGVVARVAPLAKKHKIRVAVHNHSKVHPNEFATPEDFEKAIAGPGREFMAINLDIGHFTAANFDAVAFLKKHHARIVTLHIKDRKRDQGATVPFGEGDAPIKPVLALLRERRWAIPANIEYEYPGQDPVEEVRKCVEYCRKALAGS
jgi:sugar phosphate isomerase/epimerase